MSFLYEIILKFGVFFFNFGYKVISRCAIKLNNNIHPKHKILDYHQFFIDNISENENVLDIGCGNGIVAFDIAKKANYVMGIDINRKNINNAKKEFKKNNLEFIEGDATIYEFKKEFDVVILSNVLEHIEEREKLLREIGKIASKILLRVPLITRSWLPVYLKEKGYRYKLDLTHFIEYYEEELFEEIKSAGFTIENYYVKWGELYGVLRNS